MTAPTGTEPTGTEPTGTEPSAVSTAPASPWRRVRDPLIVGGLTLLATGYVAAVDPHEVGHYPLCPTKYLSGLDCPGCGGLRAVNSLAHGDVAQAIDHNALVVLVLLPLAVVLGVRWLVRSWRGTPPPADPPWWQGRAVLWALVVLMIAFTVLRNVSGVPALAWLGSSAG